MGSRIYITGGRGFIAKNLISRLRGQGHIVLEDSDVMNLGVPFCLTPKTSEVCVHRNTEAEWERIFKDLGIDLVVHNAAVVGTDVVALDPQEAALTNVQGTYNIVRAANSASVTVCYIGTTVIYDTDRYQAEIITEDASKVPRTYYGIQKLAGEQIVSSMARDWLVVRPLFAFGGDGDMNSLIAKTLYADLRGTAAVDIFLDPNKVKDYLHVADFCSAVEMLCSTPHSWRTDYNVAAETPVTVNAVVDAMSRVSDREIGKIVRWHPGVDYLGNHMLSSAKVRAATGWIPRLTLEDGIRETLTWIKASAGYDPLRHLEEARARGVDLLQHFPSRQ